MSYLFMVYLLVPQSIQLCPFLRHPHHILTYQPIHFSKAKQAYCLIVALMLILSETLKAILLNDVDVQSGRTNIFISVEALYSMDGDLCPLKDMVVLVNRLFSEHHNAYIVIDEAHSTGLFEASGRGFVCAQSLEAQVLIRLHTFGKSVACSGAIALLPPLLKEYLINYARPLIFSTAMTHMNVIGLSTSIGEFETQHRTLVWKQTRGCLLGFILGRKELVFCGVLAESVDVKSWCQPPLLSPLFGVGKLELCIRSGPPTLSVFSESAACKLCCSPPAISLGFAVAAARVLVLGFVPALVVVKILSSNDDWQGLLALSILLLSWLVTAFIKEMRSVLPTPQAAWAADRAFVVRSTLLAFGEVPTLTDWQLQGLKVLCPGVIRVPPAPARRCQVPVLGHETRRSPGTTPKYRLIPPNIPAKGGGGVGLKKAPTKYLFAGAGCGCRCPNLVIKRA
ncbi:hypothetical protein PTTG_12464, partial [Puccinia triticina 1-1 BBBD Race 1]